MKPALAVTKAQAAYQELRSAILDGSLAPGSAFDQESLAGMLAVSTTPLREALRRLEAERLITLEAHHEVRVAPVSAAELNDLYVVRSELDPLAAELAAKTATDDELKQATVFLGTEVHTPLERLRLNRALHRTIYAACRNPVLVDILDSLWDRADRYRMLLVRNELHASAAANEHADIVAAFYCRDATTLGSLMREHIEHSMAQIPELASALELEPR